MFVLVINIPAFTPLISLIIFIFFYEIILKGVTHVYLYNIFVKSLLQKQRKNF